MAELPLWTLHVDGSSTAAASGAGLVLKGPNKASFEYALRFEFKASNNEAEYEALITGLKLAARVGAQRLRVFSDSQLVVNQVKGDYEAKEPIMAKYLEKVKSLQKAFTEFQIVQIPRSENAEADSLSKIATAEGLSINRPMYLESMPTSSIAEDTKLIAAIEEGPNWMTDIVGFLRNGTLPQDRAEARKLQLRASRYSIIDETLYKRSFSLPYLRCVGPAEAKYILEQIHQGVCGSHIGARMLAHKALRHGYYWPTMKADASEFVTRCDKCQFNSNLPHVPATPYTSLSSPWPFAQWGIDIMGPLHRATG